MPFRTNGWIFYQLYQSSLQLCQLHLRCVLSSKNGHTAWLTCNQHFSIRFTMLWRNETYTFFSDFRFSKTYWSHILFHLLQHHLGSSTNESFFFFIWNNCCPWNVLFCHTKLTWSLDGYNFLIHLYFSNSCNKNVELWQEVHVSIKAVCDSRSFIIGGGDGSELDDAVIKRILLEKASKSPLSSLQSCGNCQNYVVYQEKSYSLKIL